MEEFELEPREEIIMTVRQHIFVLLTKLIPLAVLAFVPLVLIVVLEFFIHFASLPIATIFPFGNSSLIRFIYGLWLLSLWVGAFSIFTRFYLTQWVITNIRIVDIRQYSFWNRTVSSFLLARVQDVTTNVSGVLGTLIGFGSLDVETAGSSDTFSMNGLANPTQIRDVIMGQVAGVHASGSASRGL